MKTKNILFIGILSAVTDLIFLPIRGTNINEYLGLEKVVFLFFFTVVLIFLLWAFIRYVEGGEKK